MFLDMMTLILFDPRVSCARIDNNITAKQDMTMERYKRHILELLNDKSEIGMEDETVYHKALLYIGSRARYQNSETLKDLKKEK